MENRLGCTAGLHPGNQWEIQHLVLYDFPSSKPPFMDDLFDQNPLKSHFPIGSKSHSFYLIVHTTLSRLPPSEQPTATSLLLPRFFQTVPELTAHVVDFSRHMHKLKQVLSLL